MSDIKVTTFYVMFSFLFSYLVSCFPFGEYCVKFVKRNDSHFLTKTITHISMHLCHRKNVKLYIINTSTLNLIGMCR